MSRKNSSGASACASASPCTSASAYICASASPCLCASACACTSVCAACLCACGARTRACRVHTRVNALTPPRIRTRPWIILHPLRQPSLHRIPLNVSGDLAPLLSVSHPMIIGLPLPKLLARAMQQPVSFPRCGALQRFQQKAGSNRGQYQQMDMVRHDHPRSQLVVSKAFATEQRFDHKSGNCLVPQVNGTGTCKVEVAIHPRESFAVGNFARRRKVRTRQTTVQVPREEQPAVVWIEMGKAALRSHALISGAIGYKISRSHECERGTQECVRHQHRQSTRQSGAVIA